MPTTTYWLDANVFIEAKNVAAGTIRSPKMVYEEITDSESHKDELARWAMTPRESGLFVAPAPQVQVMYRTVADHVYSCHDQPHYAEFLRGADGWLIAHALHANGVVVSHETRRKPNARKIRVPNICASLDVPCIDTYQMLRTLGAAFAVGAGSGK
jgi:hypothetical protein